jgi:phosphate transport system substrate-binding protein
MTGLRISAFLAWCFVVGFAGVPALAGSFRAELASGVEVVGEITDFRDGYYEFKVGRETKRIKLEDLVKLTQVGADATESETSEGKRSLTPEFTLHQTSGHQTTGRIVQFKDGYYDIATASGTIQVPIEDVARVTLAWQQMAASEIAAPFAEKLTGTFRIRASADAVEDLVPDLLHFYAQASGQTGRWLPRHADGSWTYSVGQSVETEDLRFEVSASPPKSAIAAVLDGKADLAVVVGEAPAEAAPVVVAAAPAATAAAGGASAAPAAAEPPSTETLNLGPAGAVVIVNEANPISQLTYEQIAGIFSGKITDWSEVGGPHRRIRVHALAQPSGVYGIAKQTVLKNSEVMLSAYQVDSLAELAEIVSADPTAIGLTEAASVGGAKPLSIVDRCGTPRAPDELSIKLRSYPLIGAFIVHTAPNAGANTQKFREFLESDLTQSYLKSRGLPNKLIVSAPDPAMTIDALEAAEGTGAANAGATGGKAGAAIERLSVAFSFRSGNTQPAEGSAEKIEGVKAFLRNWDGEPRELAVVGFSDSVGKIESNVAISAARARNVQALLAKHGIKTEKVLSLGPSLPLACESDPGGAELNRRVELWLY